VVEEAVTSLGMRLGNERVERYGRYHDMCAFDVAIAAPFISQGPIDDLFEGLGDDEDDVDDAEPKLGMKLTGDDEGDKE
ncbi:hypothetical protein HAX54_035872, partial [Datura stramonium]|nr:hypothetical protein [Datura stramonium]